MELWLLQNQTASLSFVGFPGEVRTKISWTNAKLKSLGSHLGFQAILKASSGTENQLKKMKLSFIFFPEALWMGVCLLAGFSLGQGRVWKRHKKGPAGTCWQFCAISYQHAQPNSVAAGPCPSPRLQPQYWLPSGELLKTSLHMIHSSSRLAD